MRIAILLLPFALSACCDDDAACKARTEQPARAVQITAIVQTPSPQPPPSERFVLVRQQLFIDELAYNSKRGIYVLRDTQTGREFIGVSGVGITELGSHNCGKGCIAGDER